KSGVLLRLPLVGAKWYALLPFPFQEKRGTFAPSVGRREMVCSFALPFSRKAGYFCAFRWSARNGMLFCPSLFEKALFPTKAGKSK
ncbi:MAG: hypothetical protein IKD29_04340, partial [Lentisphaeria bacterium]|nr:hypothetical protein [Lentisphaeria bacterium]